MEKKTCVITGATSGIGYGIAKGLASRNFELVLIGRDAIKGQNALSELRKITGNGDITYFNVDLCSQKQIRQVGAEIEALYPKIDVLIDNAGVWTSCCELTGERRDSEVGR